MEYWLMATSMSIKVEKTMGKESLEVAAARGTALRVKVVDQSPALPVAPNLAYQTRPVDSIPSAYVVSDSTLITRTFSF